MIFQPDFFEGLDTLSKEAPKKFFATYNLDRARAIIHNFDLVLEELRLKKEVQKQISRTLRPNIDANETPPERLIRCFCFVHTIRVLKVLQPQKSATELSASLESRIAEWLGSNPSSYAEKTVPLVAILEGLPTHLDLYRQLYSLSESQKYGITQGTQPPGPA